MKSRDLLLGKAIAAAIKAGAAIMNVYKEEIIVELKDDKSPLTLADKNAHDIISRELSSCGYPMLSEEGKHLEYSERKSWSEFWMVDPLDGTKEFIRRNGEFTVNIALIVNEQSVLGVIYAPALDKLYFSEKSIGSYRIDADETKLNALLERKEFLVELIKGSDRLPIKIDRDEITVVASRSHLNKETEDFIEKLRVKYGSKELNFVSKGSSLKICLVAEGTAKVYPRLAPTMEWDTAAGQAIAENAGMRVYNVESGEPMKYNKENLLNDWFVVEG